MSYRSGNMESGMGWAYPAGTRWESWDATAECQNDECATFAASLGSERERWEVGVVRELGATEIVGGGEACPVCGEEMATLI